MTTATSVTVSPSMAHLKTDPLRNFRFHVIINKPGIRGTLGFMSVSGLSITTEVIPYRQGGHNTTTQKMPGQSDFAPITLAKGLAVGDNDFIAWMKELFAVVQGTGTGAPGQNFRHTMDVLVLDHPVTNTLTIPVKAAFKVYNAWITALAFSDLDAGANAIIVQQMTFAHEGFDFAVANQIGIDAPSI
jgi:phage tail-like protein